MPSCPLSMRPFCCSWFLNPFRIARHNPGGYTAAFSAATPEACLCLPPCFLEHQPFRPVHIFCNSARMHSELLIHPVLFLTGLPLSPLCPYWHWSPVTRSTPGSIIICFTQPSSHESALSGCSWKKYRPPSIWARYISHTNSRCTRPLARRRLTSPSLQLYFSLLRFCQLLYSVHGGDPTSNIGF